MRPAGRIQGQGGTIPVGIRYWLDLPCRSVKVGVHQIAIVVTDVGPVEVIQGHGGIRGCTKVTIHCFDVPRRAIEVGILQVSAVIVSNMWPAEGIQG